MREGKGMIDKDIFKEMKKYAKDLTGNEDWFSNFPFLMLKVDFGDELEDSEIQEVLDRGNESINAFWIKNKVVYFAQFKASENEKTMSNLDNRDLSFFNEIEEELADGKFANEYSNNIIRNIADELEGKDSYDRVYLFYHLGYCRDVSLLDHYNKIEYINFNEIKDKWETYNSKIDMTVPEKCEISLCENSIMFCSSKQYPSLISVISGVELYRLFNEHRFRLFERNVRFYLGEKDKINSEIVKTALQKPEFFYYYNNGLTFTSKDKIANREGNNKLKLNHPQIINGAQTVNSIVHAYKKYEKDNGYKKAEDHFGRLKVLVRVITSTKGDDADFARNLTKYNNSQNKVLERDFRANSPEQKELQKKLSEYGYFYEIKRGEREAMQKGKDYYHESLNKNRRDFPQWNVKIDISKLVQIYQAYKGKPSAKEVGKDYILSNENEYEELFGSKKSDITREKTQDIILAFNLFFLVDSYRSTYDKLLKELNRASKADANWEKAKSLIKDIPFFTRNMIQDALDSESYGFLNPEVRKRLYEFSLFSASSKFFVLAVIKYIIDENKYEDDIIERGIYLDPEKIKRIFSKWLRNILIYINEVYQKRLKEKPNLSERVFILDKTTFDLIKKHIQALKYDRDLNLREEFKLDE